MRESSADELKEIVIVSDGTGGTAERLMDAVLVQYGKTNVEYTVVQKYQHVLTTEDIDRVLEDIGDECLVLFSIISVGESDYFSDRLEERGILHLNVLQPMLDTVSKFLGVHPNYQPGILQIVDDLYYKKIDAIRYTVEHDDGRGGRIDQADCVLMGLSRSCKTPISVYLACNHGLRVANIPVIKDTDIVDITLLRLQPVDPAKIIGLVIQPEKLAQIREERSNYPDTAMKSLLRSYYDIDEITLEFRFLLDLYRAQSWPTVNVTYRAIEEISKEILKLLGYGSIVKH